MVARSQTDLFVSDDEPDLFGPDYAPPVYRPDPDRVRARLYRILAEARAAKVMPWEPATVTLYCTIFPQMTFCLPENEAAQLRFDFANEMERLKAA